MTMENFEDFNSSESIFDDNSPESSSEKISQVLHSDEKYKSHLSNNFIFNIIDSISEKLGDIAAKNKSEKEQKEIQKFAQNKFAGREEIIKLFVSFGCHLTIMRDYVELYCEQFDIRGKITFGKDGQVVFDDNTIQIFRIISEIVSNSNSLEDIIDSYEKIGFYPVGALEKQMLNVEGQEVEVLVGVLENQQGTQKKIYYYDGREIFPEQ